MKTPRQLLFEKHQAALPALDQIRRKALAASFRTPESSHSFFLVRGIAKLWAELVLPCRRCWAGLAVAWVFIFGFGLALTVETASPSGPRLSVSHEMVVALLHQRQQLAELVQFDTPEPAEPARTKPQPRSFLQPATLVG